MFQKLLATILLSLSLGSAQATLVWTGKFTITALYISGASNYHVRVYGFTPISDCTAHEDWAYMNQSVAGSSEYYAALMLAYVSGKQVNLYLGPDANGYCQISEIVY